MRHSAWRHFQHWRVALSIPNVMMAGILMFARFHHDNDFRVPSAPADAGRPRAAGLGRLAQNASAISTWGAGRGGGSSACPAPNARIGRLDRGAAGAGPLTHPNSGFLRGPSNHRGSRSGP